MGSSVGADGFGIIEVLVACDHGGLVLNLHPARHHPAVGIEAVTVAVNGHLPVVPAALCLTGTAAGGEIEPVGAVRILGAAVVVIVDFLGRQQLLPGVGDHLSAGGIIVVVIVVLLYPAGLHGAVIVKIIPGSVDLSGALSGHTSVAVEVVPLGVDLSPGVGHHLSVGSYEAVVIHEVIDRHVTAASKIVIASVRSGLPLIVDLAVPVIVDPLSVLLNPAVGSKGGNGTHGKKPGCDRCSPQQFSHLHLSLFP